MKEELRTMREPEKSVSIWNETVEMCNSLDVDIEPVPKRRRPNTTFNNSNSTLGQREGITVGSSEEKVRTRFYSIIDSLLGELDARFSADNIALAKSVDSVLSLDADGAHSLLRTYSKSLNIDSEICIAEIKNVRRLIPDSKPTLKSISAITTSNTYPNFFKLLQVAITLPIGSSTCERSISVMRRIRNYTRTTQPNNRFSSLALLAVENDITAALDSARLVDQFAESGSRRHSLN